MAELRVCTLRKGTLQAGAACPCCAPSLADTLLLCAPKLPRDDFVDHIMKWASIEFCHSGDYTVPMRVEPVEGAPGQLQGFTVWLAQLDGAGKEEEVTAMRFHFDEDESNFCMTKVATGIEVTHGEDVLVQHLKFVAQKTAAAIDSYYTFGTALDGGEDF